MTRTDPAQPPDTSPDTSVAVIGMSGRFPGAPDIDTLWSNILNGVESIQDFSDADLAAAGVDLAYAAMPGFVRRGSVLAGIEQFDAGFFGYSARDAETIDPQQRIFMETVWHALEDAGVDPERPAGPIGVFAGSDQSSYIYQIYNAVDLSSYGYGGMMAIGNEKDYLTTQTSYKCNLRGPSLNVQTSCSTSLVTVVAALQNLIHGYCDVAVAGGVAIAIPQRKGYWYQPGGIVSPDGHCRPFDAEAMGTVIGSGVGVVVLKRLGDALRDGDRIDAVIRGFGLNNDGAAKVGYTAPSVDGQATAIGLAQDMAGVGPASIGYIEAHGTATALGDPIEIAALTKAFRRGTEACGYCGIGSLKSNVGHLSSASGIAGLIKAVLVVREGVVPPNPLYRTPNPQLRLETTPFFVPDRPTPWAVPDGPRRAGVSSFGVGGTNAHVVLEQAPDPLPASEAAPLQLLTLSARSPAALERACHALAGHLEANPALDLGDVAHTLQVGRKAFEHRRALIVAAKETAAAAAALRREDDALGVTRRNDAERTVVLMFSGQGTQYPNMGRGLYDAEPLFRRTVDECAEILRGEIGEDIRDIVFPEAEDAAAAARLRRTENAQPALFTVEYALARVWMARAGRPAALLGHSIGEYVAACVSGVMTLEDALGVVAMRGRLMGAMPEGSMLAVMLPESGVQALLSPEISLASVNGPSLCVLAGAHAAIDAVAALLEAQGVPATRLQTSHAFHSAMMEPCLVQFTERMRRVALAAPQIPYLSNVTGQWITPELAASPEYWAAQLRMTVRFADNLREVLAFPDLALIEAGPGHSLQYLASQQGSRATSHVIVPSLRAASEDVADDVVLLHSMARLWTGGLAIDWRGMRGDERRSLLRLPLYPFERRRYWLGPSEEDRAATTGAAVMAPRSQIGIDGTPLAVAPAATGGAHFHEPVWTRRDHEGPAPVPPAGSRWLLLGEGPVADAAAAGLGRAGATVVRALPGRRYSRSARKGQVRLRLDAPEDYDAMIRFLAEGGGLPERILHLGVAPAGAAPLSEDDLLVQGFFSVVHLGQALARHAGNAGVGVTVATDRLQPITGDEPAHCSGAPAEAACRAVSQEHPALRFRTVDVDARDAEAAAAGLIGEALRDAPEPAAALRRAARFVRDHPLRRLDPPVGRPALLADGVYVITGGLGNVGLVLAEAIAVAVKARLVLVGRSGLPERSRWDGLAASGQDPALARRIARVRALEAAGAEVMAVAADLTDPAAAEALARSVADRWGPPHAIVHAAAELDRESFTPLAAIDRRSAAAHFGAKVRGLVTLERAFAPSPPRLWVMVSSISAILGGLDLGAYAAANAMLDGWAEMRNREGAGRWISVNWDAWSFEAAAAPEALSPPAGRDAFLRVLADGRTRMAVAAAPLTPRLARWATLGAPASAAPAGATAPAASGNGGSHPRPDLGTPYQAPATPAQEKICEIWSYFLGVEPIGIDDRFFELGGHSLLAIQVLAKLRDAFGVEIPVHRLFEAPTVRQLAAALEKQTAEAGTPATNAPTNGAAGAEDEDIEEMMRLVEELSEAEVEALLAQCEREEGHVR